MDLFKYLSVEMLCEIADWERQRETEKSSMDENYTKYIQNKTKYAFFKFMYSKQTNKKNKKKFANITKQKEILSISYCVINAVVPK